jgi:hypothetical protein
MNRVPRSWLTRPRGGLPASVWVNRAALGAAALALVMALAVWLAPLKGAGSGSETVALPEVGFADLAPSGSGASAGTIARLSSGYLFTPGRQPFAELEPLDTTGEAAVAEADDRDAPAVEREALDEGSGVRVVRVEAPEAVGGDIQSSYRELVLRGIHSDRSGELVALIDFRGTPVGAASVRAGEGDRFVEPKNPEQPWDVVAVDPDRNRVVIERQGRRLALALFGTGPADLSPIVIVPESAVEDGPVRVRVAEDGTLVVQQSPEEAVAQLRQEPATDSEGGKPITMEDLAELLRAVRDLERYGDKARQEQRPDR